MSFVNCSLPENVPFCRLSDVCILWCCHDYSEKKEKKENKKERKKETNSSVSVQAISSSAHHQFTVSYTISL